MKGLTWRSFTVIASILFAIYLLIPTVLKFSTGQVVSRISKPEDPWYYSILPSETLKLGLDLQGGLHLVLGIDFNEVERDATQKLAGQIKDVAGIEKISGITVAAHNNLTIEVKYEDEAEFKKLDDYLARNFDTALDLASQTGKVATFRMSNEYLRLMRNQAMDQSLETLRNRIDEFGISEPIISRQGEDKLLVQFPGVQDPTRVKDVISRTAKLTFQIARVVPGSGAPSREIEGWVKEFNTEKKTSIDPQKPISEYLTALNTYLEKKLPKGTEIRFEKKTNKNTKEVFYNPYLLETQVMVSGDELEDARVSYDKNNKPIVTFQLTAPGAVKFEKATGDNVGKPMAIVLDNTVHSAPNIRGRIGGGNAMIEMGDTGKGFDQIQNEARDTALVLRSGALPARLIFLEERIIGPSLGADAIRSGVQSFAGGLLLVFLLLLVYYRASGFVATGALALNALFVLALLAAFEGTLTLPGLAGLTLSLGMSVDANVLIFEHIREELKMGKSVASAIGEGYTRAWSAIFDGNLTAIIAGLVLLSFGYGPIRGFAVTTLMGLICSMYTAVFVTRVVFDTFVIGHNRKTLSI